MFAASTQTATSQSVLECRQSTGTGIRLQLVKQRSSSNEAAPFINLAAIQLAEYLPSFTVID